MIILSDHWKPQSTIILIKEDKGNRADVAVFIGNYDLLVSKVPALMVTHVALGPEALAAALRAVEGPLVGVDPLMDAEILLLTEGFATGGEVALVRLSAVMQV